MCADIPVTMSAGYHWGGRQRGGRKSIYPVIGDVALCLSRLRCWGASWDLSYPTCSLLLCGYSSRLHGTLRSFIKLLCAHYFDLSIVTRISFYNQQYILSIWSPQNCLSCCLWGRATGWITSKIKEAAIVFLFFISSDVPLPYKKEQKWRAQTSGSHVMQPLGSSCHSISHF